MTDITDQEARALLEDAQIVQNYGASTRAAKHLARHILATVDAPTPTLAEELMDWSHKVFLDEDGKQTMRDYSARAEQIEQERDHFFREVEDVRNWKERLINERDEARAEVERLTAERADRPADTLPDPTDVPAGEAWVVKVDRTEPTVGFSANGTGWCCYRPVHGTALPIGDDRITLVSRLVPAPRQITTREELDALPRRTVIRDKDGVVCERTSLGEGWYSPESTTDQTHYITFPATVLWTPEETA